MYRSPPIFLTYFGLCLFDGYYSLTFETFLETFNKNYSRPEEYNRRRQIFTENYQELLAHNQLYAEGETNSHKSQSSENLFSGLGLRDSYDDG